MDNGFHIPQSRHAEGTLRTEFTYLHYHNKPYELVQAHTRRKLASRVDVDDREALRAYDGPGTHMTKDLLMSQDEYLRQFDSAITLQFEPFANLTRALGARDPMLIGSGRSLPGVTLGRPTAAPSDNVTLRLPPAVGTVGAQTELVVFDGAGYLEDNPDVAATATSGLPHYLYYGFQEQRTLRRQQPGPGRNNKEPQPHRGRMNSATPVHDFLQQRLSALVAEATSHGIARDVAVAVLTDLITAPQFNDAAPIRPRIPNRERRHRPSRE